MVLISDQSSYLLFTGSAAALADDIAATYSVLSGPPDLLSAEWNGAGDAKRLARIKDAQEAKAQEESAHTARACAQRYLRFNVLVSQGGTRIRFKIYPAAQADAVEKIGLQPGDIIEGIDNRPIQVEDGPYAIMHRVTHGVVARLTVERSLSAGSSESKRLDVVLTQSAVRQAFGDCFD